MNSLLKSPIGYFLCYDGVIGGEDGWLNRLYHEMGKLFEWLIGLVFIY